MVLCFFFQVMPGPNLSAYLTQNLHATIPTPNWCQSHELMCFRVHDHLPHPTSHPVPFPPRRIRQVVRRIRCLGDRSAEQIMDFRQRQARGARDPTDPGSLEMGPP